MHWLKPVWGVIGVRCPELGGVHFSEVKNVQYPWGNQSGGMRFVCFLVVVCFQRERFTVIFPLYSSRSISSA